ncbi:MAG: type I methionyl aminopeptidase [Candidatus Zambryskibacteria bacterium CG10_big_fil_rev_8_21_14_0_10_42_12]|uniref:Methionine aminopeptidase n=1 Tax=Candidatus Zambryskibacteria bacterium CG10_big_fil_rev_8_21_14_0_10_42_12 TaxID=1975115 RepID=A0A2H0QWE2_9BACT|nr:MAG: type I methionyl aminopeptidase [Candidatus Zambryskibacteria bacterium CG10_big_fil_rev_8_21_14_0_10_42_12]
MIRLKTKEEIAILREGGRRHARILRELKDLTVPGVSSFDLEKKARELIHREEGEAAFLDYTPEGAARPYPAALCFSVNDEVVHGIPNEKEYIVKDGDVITLDLGFVYKGLITDSAITVIAGKGTDESKKLVRATREALEAGIKVVQPGKFVGDIGAAVEKVAHEYGCSLAKGLSGHGVGYEVHEDPFVPNEGARGTGEELVSGMVIAIEPMLTLGGGKVTFDKGDGYTYRTKDGSLAAHFEHTVAVTDEGYVVLTVE